MSEVFWDNRVVFDLFLGGIGIGAFLLGAVLYFLNSEKYETIIKRSWIISPFLIILGLVILLTELGKPFNIVQALFNVNPTSFMSIGIYLQGICIILMLFVLFNIKKVSKLLVGVTSIFAVLVGLYHGFLLTGMEKVVWNSSVPLIFFLSSIISGGALSLLVSSSTPEYKNIMESKKLPLFFTFSLVLLFTAVLSWAFSLSVSNEESKTAYTVLMSSFSTEFLMLVLTLGIVIPLVLFIIALTKTVEVKTIFLPTALCILVGSFFLKHLFVYFGQMV